MNIKFGTDGWRAIIAQEYTVYNVKRVTEAVAKWLSKYKKPKVAVGYDCRFGGKMFADEVCKLLLKKNIEVLMSNTYIPTPVVSFITKEFNCDLGIMITASHNPYNYNGYKLKDRNGGSLSVEYIKEIEKIIPNDVDFVYNFKGFEEYIKTNQYKTMDFMEHYDKHVNNVIDLNLINTSNLKIGFDPMYGSGKKVMSRYLKNIVVINNDENPYFNGTNPEPIQKNLTKLKKTILKNKLDIGFAVDGDADRIAILDKNGSYIDSHRIILLLLYYLTIYKKMRGKVCTTFSASNKISKYAKSKGLDVEITPVGFKYIAEIMKKEDVIIGGEESGGIAIKGHILERDGIFIALVICELILKTKKTINQILDEIYKDVGSFGVYRKDLTINENKKNEIIKKCEKNEYSKFNNYIVKEVQTIDGYKFIIDENSWVMIRKSGTEPILRIYSEAENLPKSKDIVKQTIKTILN